MFLFNRKPRHTLRDTVTSWDGKHAIFIVLLFITICYFMPDEIDLFIAGSDPIFIYKVNSNKSELIT